MAIKIHLLPKRDAASNPPSRPRSRRVRHNMQRPLLRSRLVIYAVAVAAFLLLIFLLMTLL
jgi:cell division protein FtsX